MVSRKRRPIGEESVTITIPVSVAQEAVEALKQRTVDCHYRASQRGRHSKLSREECDYYERCAEILRNAITGRWPIPS